jgi:hypothetical protein
LTPEGAGLPAGFNHGHYVPVILTRQGERLALRVLDPMIKDHVTPLFVLHPVPKDLDTEQPQVSVDEHVRKAPAQLLRDWGTRPAMIDLKWLPSAERMSDDSHPLYWLCNASHAAGLTLAPSLSAGRDDAYRQAACDAARATGSSLCFRLPPDEWADLTEATGQGRLLALLAEADLPPESVHLILDVEGDVNTNAAITANAMRSALRALPHANAWRSVTVAGTAMPTGTADIGANNAALLPRSEWLLWRLLADGDHRLPAFGDYGVQHPDPMSDFDPRYMQSSAQLRYTIARDWFVARGRGMRVAGNEQIRDLATQVVEHDEYAGPDFSWGDHWLHECATSSCSAGNQMVWRKVATSHHLTYVARQIATHVGS